MAHDLAIRIAEEQGLSDARLDLIRNVAAAGCSDEELAQLLILSHRTGLDPLARQIYMIKRNVKRGDRWVEVATPQTGIDGYRLVADRTERYAPGREPSYQHDAEGRLVSATAYVKKLAAGTWHEVAATAFWDEYVQTRKDGKPTAMWEKMPRVMLAKCAEALALRRAFPAELSGLYTVEEMAQADNPAITVEPIPVVEAPASSAPLCEECAFPITPAHKMSAEQLAEYTKGKYGRELCAVCAAAEKAKQEVAA